jgi:AcrR family transcriptional regulator
LSPRSFSEAERAAIRERLVAVAADQFARYGYRRANVAEIAREVGIGKGTLYLFFGWKADLFVAAVERVEEGMRKRLIEEMRRPYPSERARLRRFLQIQRDALAEEPLLAVLVDPMEAAALMRDLPVERMEELRVSDERFFAALAEEWEREGARMPVAPRVLAALPRALFAMTLQRGLIGEEVFPEVMDLVVDSLTRALAPDPDDDA